MNRLIAGQSFRHLLGQMADGMADPFYLRPFTLTNNIKSMLCIFDYMYVLENHCQEVEEQKHYHGEHGDKMVGLDHTDSKDPVAELSEDDEAEYRGEAGVREDGVRSVGHHGHRRPALTLREGQNYSPFLVMNGLVH